MKRILKLLLIGVMVICPNIVHAETLDINSSIVKELDKKYLLTGDNGYYSHIKNLYYILSEKFDINSDEKIVEMLSYLSSNMHTVTVSGIEFVGLTVEEYENNFKEIFGPDAKLKQITDINSTNCMALHYDKTANVYYSGNCGSSGPGYYQYIKSASQDNSNIYINVKTYGPVYDEEIAKGKKYIVPLDDFDENLNTNMPVNSYDSKEVDQKYGNYLDTYKFTFKKASDNKYYFYSVENLNDAKEYKVDVSKGNVQTHKKEKNPKTADQNIIMISIIGIFSIFVFVKCSQKVGNK